MSHIHTVKSKASRVVIAIFVLLILAATESLVNADSNAVGTNEPELFNRCWDYKGATNLSVVPVVDSTAVYFIDAENNLLAIDPGTAVRLWSSELGGEVISNLLLYDTSIFLVTNSPVTDGSSAPKAFLRSISRATGITEWRVAIRTSESVAIGGYPGAIVVVGTGGLVSAVTRAEGKVLWDRELGASVTTSPLFGADGIVVGTEKKEIVQVAITDGGTRTLSKSEHLPTALVVENSGRLVIGDERGSVTSVGADGDRAWAFRNGARISSVLLDASDYLASSNDNFVYRLTRSGNVKWKRRLPGRLAQAPVLLGDVSVMSVSSGGGIFVLDMNKGKIINRIETAPDATLMIGASTDGKNFVVAGPSAVSYFSRAKCSSK